MQPLIRQGCVKSQSPSCGDKSQSGVIRTIIQKRRIFALLPSSFTTFALFQLVEPYQLPIRARSQLLTSTRCPFILIHMLPNSSRHSTALGRACTGFSSTTSRTCYSKSLLTERGLVRLPSHYPQYLWQLTTHPLVPPCTTINNP